MLLWYTDSRDKDTETQIEAHRCWKKTYFIQISLVLKTGHWTMFHTIRLLIISYLTYFPNVKDIVWYCDTVIVWYWNVWNIVGLKKVKTLVNIVWRIMVSLLWNKLNWLTFLWCASGATRTAERRRVCAAELNPSAGGWTRAHSYIHGYYSISN